MATRNPRRAQRHLQVSKKAVTRELKKEGLNTSGLEEANRTTTTAERQVELDDRCIAVATRETLGSLKTNKQLQVSVELSRKRLFYVGKETRSYTALAFKEPPKFL